MRPADKRTPPLANSPSSERLGEELLATKLYAPPVRASTVARARLIDLIDEGTRNRITLVSAHAGLGKSTLLGEWMLQSSLPAGWLSIDKGDNDTTRFLSYLVAALQNVEGGIGEGILASLRSPQPPPARAVLTKLINEISTLSRDFALIIDDYHLIESEEVHDALAFLIEHMPPQMHLVISSRTDPPLPMPRLLAQGYLTELDASELRFTLEEASTFIGEAMELDLSPEDMRMLEEKTEGWIAALQLAALSIRGREDVSSFVSAFSGSERHIFDYLAEEVLRKQPERIQEFLMLTSILDRMCAPLCETLIGREGGQAVLETLERANLFVVPLDDERRWYRYHHLFSDFLRERLRRESPEVVPELHIQASEWYEQNRLPDEAIDHALRARDFERAADLVERSAQAFLEQGGYATVYKWATSIPQEAIRSRPHLFPNLTVFPLLARGELDAAEARVRDIERHMGISGDEGAPIEDEELARAAGYAAGARANIAMERGDRRGMVRYCSRALELLAEDDRFLRSLAANRLAYAYRDLGNIAAADRALEEAIKTSRRGNVPFWTAISLCNLGQLRTIQGRLSEAAEVYEQALRFAAEHGDYMKMMASAMSNIGMGELLLEGNDLQAAEQRLLEGIGTRERDEIKEETGTIEASTGYALMARVKEAQGDPEGALDAIAKAKQVAQGGGGSHHWKTRAEAWEARLWIEQGNLRAAERWSQRRGLGTGDGLDHSRESELEYITLARLLVARGRNEEANGLLERLLQAAVEGGRVRTAIEGLTLQAVAFRGLGDNARAVTTLRRALLLAEPEGYVRTFADEGEPMVELLRQLVKTQSRRPPDPQEGVSPEYLGTLLDALGAGVAAWSGASMGEAASLLVDPISERELEVLRLLDSDLTNREIAARLFVSLDTVKSHTKHLYRKLDVRARHQAVTRAKELGLLQ